VIFCVAVQLESQIGLYSQVVLGRFMADKGNAKGHRGIVDEEHHPRSLQMTRGFRQLPIHDSTNEPGNYILIIVRSVEISSYSQSVGVYDSSTYRLGGLVATDPY